MRWELAEGKAVMTWVAEEEAGDPAADRPQRWKIARWKIAR